jgi:hypothetical protein
MKAKLAVATQVSRKYGPWVTLATSALVIANDLRPKKDS